MLILNHKQIEQKIRRLAVQILENNFKEKEIILSGINNTGFQFAQMLHKEIKRMQPEMNVRLNQLKLDPSKPLSQPIEMTLTKKEVSRKSVIVVDDVANSGRTLYYALRPLMEAVPKKVQLAVLVDRTHKTFPVRVDFVGLQLATTLKDHIHVEIAPDSEWSVFLD